MIGQFNPAVIAVGTSFITAPGISAVIVRATSAATELANDIKWLEVV